MTTNATPVSETPKPKLQDFGFSAVYAALIGYGQPRLLGDTHTLLPCRMDLIQKQEPNPNYDDVTGFDLVVVEDFMEEHGHDDFAHCANASDFFAALEQLARVGAHDISIYHRQIGVQDRAGNNNTRTLVCELVSTPKAEELPW